LRANSAEERKQIKMMTSEASVDIFSVRNKPLIFWISKSLQRIAELKYMESSCSMDGGRVLFGSTIDTQYSSAKRRRVRPESESKRIGKNNSMGRKQDKGSSVVIIPYGEAETTDPLEWPSGKLLLYILKTEKVLDHHQDEEYWQASVRRALLRKFGFHPKGAAEAGASSDTLDQIDIPSVQNRWKEVIQLHMQDGEKTSDLLDFLLSQCRSSNNRTLQWSFMQCPPGLQFELHAHPNIELVYCVTGALHEIRMQGEPVTKQFERKDDDAHKVCGPNLAGLKRPWSFGTLAAGQWLVNEVGSIHKSFTATNGSCQLLTLWGGSHANVQDPPVTPNVQDAVDTMDRRLTSCDCTVNWAAISETFLPDSEKSSACGAVRDSK
jgi:hypothetical protein